MGRHTVFRDVFSQPGVRDPDQKYAVHFVLSIDRRVSDPDSAGAGLERGEERKVQKNRADGHLCAIFHLHGGHGVHHHAVLVPASWDHEYDYWCAWL